MRRVALRVGTVVVAVVLSLISTALAAGAASATEPCRLNMVWAGRVGEVNASLADPKLKARFTDLGGTPLVGSPADFGKLIAEETEKWGNVIRSAKLRAE